MACTAIVLVPVVIVVVAGWAHRWVADDAFIDFRIVGNALHGHGPVYNIGERVEAYTDPLWLGMLIVARGVFPFVPIEWSAVLMGLACTAAGFALGGAAVVQLANRSRRVVALPLGMLAVSAVAASWEFATSGLETGLIFFWLGLSWWLLVRAYLHRRGAGMPALVAGLGVLIRPDMAILSVALLAGLLAVMATTEWEGPSRRWSRWGLPVLGFVALPALYELWRMAYFGLLVPNTALAKSAGVSWWSQGWLYLRNLVDTYYLWIPLVILAVAVGATLRRDRDRALTIVVVAPIVGALGSALYVVRVGGDFMHARMLLPALFAMALPLWVEMRRSAVQAAAAVTVVAWAAVSVTAFRYNAPYVGGIGDERSIYVAVSHNPHPVTLSGYSKWGWRTFGLQLADMAAHTNGPQKLILGPEDWTTPVVLVHTRFHGTVIVGTPNIGISGDSAGPNVFVFDDLSLANPIGSHFTIRHRARPGHEKHVPEDWMVARFASPNTVLPPGAYTVAGIADARAAIGCQPLSGYLKAVDAPWSFGRAMSDIFHSLRWTTMHFDANPARARADLCGARTATGRATASRS